MVEPFWNDPLIQSLMQRVTGPGSGSSYNPYMEDPLVRHLVQRAGFPLPSRQEEEPADDFGSDPLLGLIRDNAQRVVAPAQQLPSTQTPPVSPPFPMVSSHEPEEAATPSSGLRHEFVPPQGPQPVQVQQSKAFSEAGVLPSIPPETLPSDAPPPLQQQETPTRAPSDRPAWLKLLEQGGAADPDEVVEAVWSRPDSSDVGALSRIRQHYSRGAAQLVMGVPLALGHMAYSQLAKVSDIYAPAEKLFATGLDKFRAVRGEMVPSDAGRSLFEEISARKDDGLAAQASVFAERGMEVIPNMTAIMLTGMASGGALAPFMVAATSGAGSEWDSLQSQGEEDIGAVATATLVGLSEGIFDSIVPGKMPVGHIAKGLVGKIDEAFELMTAAGVSPADMATGVWQMTSQAVRKGAAATMKDIFRAAGVEGLTESVQFINQYGAEALLTDAKRGPFWQGLAESATLGTVVGAGMRGGVMAPVAEFQTAAHGVKNAIDPTQGLERAMGERMYGLEQEVHDPINEGWYAFQRTRHPSEVLPPEQYLELQERVDAKLKLEYAPRMEGLKMAREAELNAAIEQARSQKKSQTRAAEEVDRKYHALYSELARETGSKRVEDLANRSAYTAAMHMNDPYGRPLSSVIPTGEQQFLRGLAETGAIPDDVMAVLDAEAAEMDEGLGPAITMDDQGQVVEVIRATKPSMTVHEFADRALDILRMAAAGRGQTTDEMLQEHNLRYSNDKGGYSPLFRFLEMKQHGTRKPVLGDAVFAANSLLANDGEFNELYLQLEDILEDIEDGPSAGTVPASVEVRDGLIYKGETYHSDRDGDKMIVAKDDDGNEVGFLLVRPVLDNEGNRTFQVKNVFVESESRGTLVPEEMYRQAWKRYGKYGGPTDYLGRRTPDGERMHQRLSKTLPEIYSDPETIVPRKMVEGVGNVLGNYGPYTAGLAEKIAPSARFITMFSSGKVGEAMSFRTFMHEIGHSLDDIGSELRSPELLEYMKENDGLDSSGRFNSEGMEIVADGLTNYFDKGVAPTPELQPIFDRLGAWVRNSAAYVHENVDMDDPRLRSYLERILVGKEADTRTEHPLEGLKIDKKSGLLDFDTLDEPDASDEDVTGGNLFPNSLPPVRRQRDPQSGDRTWEVSPMVEAARKFIQSLREKGIDAPVALKAAKWQIDWIERAAPTGKFDGGITAAEDQGDWEEYYKRERQVADILDRAEEVRHKLLDPDLQLVGQKLRAAKKKGGKEAANALSAADTILEILAVEDPQWWLSAEWDKAKKQKRYRSLRQLARAVIKGEYPLPGKRPSGAVPKRPGPNATKAELRQWNQESRRRDEAIRKQEDSELEQERDDEFNNIPQATQQSPPPPGAKQINQKRRVTNANKTRTAAGQAPLPVQNPAPPIQTGAYGRVRGGIRGVVTTVAAQLKKKGKDWYPIHEGMLGVEGLSLAERFRQWTHDLPDRIQTQLFNRQHIFERFAKQEYERMKAAIGPSLKNMSKGQRKIALADVRRAAYRISRMVSMGRGDQALAMAPLAVQTQVWDNNLNQYVRTGDSWRAVMSGLTGPEFTAAEALASSEFQLEYARVYDPNIDKHLAPPDPKMTAKAAATINIIKARFGVAGFKRLQAISSNMRAWSIRAQLEPLVAAGRLTPEGLQDILRGGTVESRADRLEKQGKLSKDQADEIKSPPKNVSISKHVDNMVNAGRLSSAMAKELMFPGGPNDMYVPAMRVIEENVGAIAIEEGEAVDPLHARHGDLSHRGGFFRPALSWAIRAQQIAKWSHRQIIRNELYKKFEQDPSLFETTDFRGNKGSEMVLIDGPGASLEDVDHKKEFIVWRDGQPIRVGASPELIETLQPTHENHAMIYNFAAEVARTFRQAATSGIGFILGRNWLRDQVEAFVNSEYGYNPLMMFPIGLAAAIPALRRHLPMLQKYYNEYWSQGGPGADIVSYDMKRGDPKQLLDNMMDTSTGKRRWLKDHLRSMMNQRLLFPIYPFMVLSGTLEQASRLGVYINARGAGKVRGGGLNVVGKAKAIAAGPGNAKGTSSLDAIHEARESTVDFYRQGKFVGWWNGITPFYNAQFQGFARTMRSFQERGWLTTMKALTAVTLPAIANLLINADDEEYWNLPWHERMSFLHAGARVRLPRPMGILNSLFGYGIERPLAALMGILPPLEREELKESLGAFLASFYHNSPVSSLTPGSSESTPKLLGLLNETSTNWNEFRGRPIIPRSEEGMNPEIMGLTRTGPVARGLTKFMRPLRAGRYLPKADKEYGLQPNPYQVQHMIDSLVPNWGSLAMRTGDLILAGLNMDEVIASPDRGLDFWRDVAKMQARVPIGMGSQPMIDFYELKRRTDAKKKEYNVMVENGKSHLIGEFLNNNPEYFWHQKVDAANRQVRELIDQREAVERHAQLEVEDKIAMMATLDAKMTELTSSFLALMKDEAPQVYRGEVTEVIDGDTLDIRRSWFRRVRLRLNSIDAPEIGQEYGPEAQQHLSSLVGGVGQELQVTATGTDPHGRTLANVPTLGGQDASQEMIEAGLAWQYYSRDPLLTEMMERAKVNGRGLWASPNPMQPELYRRQQDRQAAGAQ